MRAALARPARPLWLMTLADLSLLLVGFFVFLQATSHKPDRQKAAISAGIREAFGGEREVRLVIASNSIAGFTAGSAALPADPAAMTGWAREALTDPRTHLILTGYADGSAADRANGSALALAGLRAEAAASGLGKSVPPDRLHLAAAIAPGARRVALTISYDP